MTCTEFLNYYMVKLLESSVPRTLLFHYLRLFKPN